MKDEARFAASIVIPAYNAAQRIGIPLKALTAQEIEDGSFEVIIVDNASTDDTAAVSSGHPAVAELVRRQWMFAWSARTVWGLTMRGSGGSPRPEANSCAFWTTTTFPTLGSWRRR